MKMEQRLVARTDLRQMQRQILSPRIIQSIQVLQLATPELDRLVQHELSENPALELGVPNDGAMDDAPTDGLQTDPSGEVNKDESDRLERDLDFLERYTDDFNDGNYQKPSARLEGEEDAKLQALANAPARLESLQEYLLQQITLLDIDQCIRDAAVLIVQALDGDGLLVVPLESVIGDRFGEGSVDVGAEALEVVKSLEPIGVGASSPQEALLLQIEKNDQDFPLYQAVLRDHWEDMLRNKLPKIAKETGYAIDDIKFAIEQIATLTPYPGRAFSVQVAQNITPDIVIDEEADKLGQYRVRMVDDFLPRLRVSNIYRDMLGKAEKAKDKETVDYLRIKVENARALIEAVQQRQSTLERVGNSILQHQHDYMEQGVSGLKPLKMQDVADELKIHVSTVCRAVADKYMDTPQGTQPLKFFFVGGTETADGEDTSRHAVKEELRVVVDAEDKTKPLSDDAIGKALSDKLGIKIARRTVAKYRDQLQIPDSRQRKTY